MTRFKKVGVVGLATIATACGGGYTSPTPTPTPNNPFRMTISASGAVSPVELVVPPGTRVLFINNDARRHDMTSDPHPEHTDCPALNQVGLLTTGQSRESGNLVAVGPGSWVDELLAVVGGDNVLAASGVRYPKISLEEVLRGQPEVILDLSFAGKNDTSVWNQVDVPAVKAGRVIAMNEPFLLAPSPRIRQLSAPSPNGSAPAGSRVPLPRSRRPRAHRA